MQVHRGRAFVRAWPRRRDDATGTAAVVGLIECSGDVEDEVIHGMALTTIQGTVLLAATGKTMHRDERYGHPFEDKASDIDYVLTGRSWPRPDPTSGLDGGGLMVRRTRAPAPEGRTIFILTGLMSTDELVDQTMVEVEGRLDGTLMLGGAKCAKSLGTNGSTLCQVMKMPLWEWDDGDWVLTSTMHLDALDECRRLEQMREGLVEASSGEIEKLERGMAGDVMGTGRRDGSYQEFRRRWRERHGPMDGRRWRGWETAAEADETTRRTSVIAKEMSREPLGTRMSWDRTR